MDRNTFLVTVGSSICAHIWLLIFFVMAIKFGMFGSEIVRVEPEPIVFELANAFEKPKRVIETPDDAQVVENQRQADFLSDKNALARNEEPNNDLLIDDPFSRGEFKFEELPTNRGPVGEQVRPNDQSEKLDERKKNKNDKTKHGDYYVSVSEFNRDVLTNNPKQNPGVSHTSPHVHYDNQASRASDMGSVSFNTYDWDFAPYMLELQRKVNSNVFPPPAYTHMMIISGVSQLSFRVYPDGKLMALQVLKVGHEALAETSSRAIELAAPFMPLPSDFPKPYLQVKYTFIYPDYRRK